MKEERLTIRINESLKEEYKRICESENKSVSEKTTEMIIREISKKEK